MTNNQITITKQKIMTKRNFDLEDRTLEFGNWDLFDYWKLVIGA